MGRLPTLSSLRLPHMSRGTAATIVLSGVALGACNDDKPAKPPTAGRSEVVLAKDAPSQPSAGAANASAAASTASSQAAPAASARKPPRRICETEMARPGRALAKGLFDPAAAPGVPTPEASLDTGGGRWTWINFFAAWCAPCKEEIPVLRAWEQKLAAGLRVRFISLDDDERQLGRFLGEQPAAGVRSALWLKPGNHRDSFLQGLKLPDSPSLPAHALVDPQGRVRCAFEGVISEADYPQVEAIVARR